MYSKKLKDRNSDLSGCVNAVLLDPDIVERKVPKPRFSIEERTLSILNRSYTINTFRIDGKEYLEILDEYNPGDGFWASVILKRMIKITTKVRVDAETKTKFEAAQNRRFMWIERKTHSDYYYTTVDSAYFQDLFKYVSAVDFRNVNGGDL